MSIATTPTTAVLLRDTIRALRGSDLRFTGTPKIVRRPPSRCLFVTDARSVFVKLTLDNPTEEAVGARHAASNGIKTARLLSRPRQVDEQWWAVPFKWIPADTDAPEPTPAEVAEIMARVWAASPPASVRDMPWDAYEKRARANIVRHATPPALQAVLERLIDTAMECVHEHVSTAHPTGVQAAWTHGDLHGRNIISSRGGLHVIDWEHHGMSLRENEAAKYLQTLLSETAAGQGATAAEPFLRELAATGLDPVLVWRLTGLRAAGAAAYLANPDNLVRHADWLAQTIDLAHRAAFTDPW